MLSRLFSEQSSMALLWSHSLLPGRFTGRSAWSLLRELSWGATMAHITRSGSHNPGSAPSSSKRTSGRELLAVGQDGPSGIRGHGDRQFLAVHRLPFAVAVGEHIREKKFADKLPLDVVFDDGPIHDCDVAVEAHFHVFEMPRPVLWSRAAAQAVDLLLFAHEALRHDMYEVIRHERSEHFWVVAFAHPPVFDLQQFLRRFRLVDLPKCQGWEMEEQRDEHYQQR